MQDRLPQYALAEDAQGQPFAIGPLAVIQRLAFETGRLNRVEVEYNMTTCEWTVTGAVPLVTDFGASYPQYTGTNMEVVLRYLYGHVLSLPEGADQ